MWLLASAFAAPVFVSEDPRAIRLATQAWRVATECAGMEAPAADTVPIELGDPGGGFAGRAYFEGGRLTRIRATKVDPENLAHEVAHAWSVGGPAALDEGGADLLAECMSRRRPDVFPPPSPSALDDLQDLSTWENTDYDTTSRSATYAASYQLFQLAATVLPERSLWRRGWTWESFDAHLVTDGGTLGEQLIAVLQGGAAAQRAALTDADGDGLASVLETAGGTDPARWDTDGDGWWDGAPSTLPSDAVPLPRARTPRCSGKRAGPRGAQVIVEGGGPAGSDPPHLVVEARAVDEISASIPPHASILLEGVRAGWGVVRGTGLVPDDRCWSEGRRAVVAAPGLEEALPLFVAALLRAEAAADELLGRSDAWVLVRLGDPLPANDRDSVGHRLARTVVPASWLANPGYAAAIVVATGRLEGAHVPREPSLREALARRLVETPPAEALVAKDLAHVEAWSAAVAGCEGGWRTLVAGGCGRMLADPDGDGLPGAAARASADEDLLGVAVSTPGAIQLAADRLPVCTGLAAGPEGAAVSVLGGRANRNGPTPRLYADGRWQQDAPSNPAQYEVGVGRSLLLAASSAEAGWGAIGGTGLVPDRRCWSDARWTVLARPGQESALPRFVKALLDADGRAETLLDQPARRLLVLLGDDSAGLSHPYTSVRSGWLEDEDIAYVAAYAVASERLRAAPITRHAPAEVGLYEALARALVPSPPAVFLLAMDASDLAPWDAMVNACKGGWRAYAAGACER